MGKQKGKGRDKDRQKKQHQQNQHDRRSSQQAYAKGRAKGRGRQKGKHESEDAAFSLSLSTQGLFVKRMDGDGNCLFRSLADQLCGDEGEHPRVRREVCVGCLDMLCSAFAFLFQDSTAPHYGASMCLLLLYCACFSWPYTLTPIVAYNILSLPLPYLIPPSCILSPSPTPPR